MLKNKKIQDKSLNLDVKGQGTGCWDDCFLRSGYWERKTSHPNCSWIAPAYDWKDNFFS